MSKFLFLVDESGDAGIEKIRAEGQSGASPYMTLGGVLVAQEDVDHLRDQLIKLCLEINKATLHCKDLRHFQKLHFAKTMATMPVAIFGLISYKTTLGGYKAAIEGDSTKFYNTCARYLLERLGDFMALNDIKSHQVDIVFEEGNFAYDKLRNYISICQDRPMGKTPQQIANVKLLGNISSNRITAVPKADEILLQLPDLVAHAVYKCVDKSNGCFRITEPRYLKEIANLFFADPENGKVVGKGLKPVHSLRALDLDDDIYSFFDGLMKPLKESL